MYNHVKFEEALPFTANMLREEIELFDQPLLLKHEMHGKDVADWLMSVVWP